MHVRDAMWHINIGPASLLALLASLAGAGCASPSVEDDGLDNGASAASAPSTKHLELQLDSEVVFETGTVQHAIEEQMALALGQLSEKELAGKLDTLVLANVRTISIPDPDGQDRPAFKKANFHATLALSTSTTTLSRSYELILPSRVDGSAFSRFQAFERAGCVDPEGTWPDNYRPERRGCSLPAKDVVRTSALVREKAAK